MISSEQALDLVAKSIQELTESGIIENPVDFSPEIVLLGQDAVLDSIGLITLLSDLEEKVSTLSGAEKFLMLNEIHDFNDDKQALTAQTLAEYIRSIVS